MRALLDKLYIREAVGNLLIVLILAVVVPFGYVRKPDVRRDVNRVLLRWSWAAVDSCVRPVAAMIEFVAGYERRVDFVVWYNEWRGHELPRPHMMTKQQIERSD